MSTKRDPLSHLVSSSTEPGATPPDAVEMLGWMLQLRGSVRMAMVLDSATPPERPPPARLPAGAEVPRLRTKHVEMLAVRPLYSPFRGAHGLPDADRMRAHIVSNGLHERRRRPEIDQAANQLASGFHGLIGERIGVARSGMADLRRQLRDSLRLLGPAAAYLEWVDAELRECTEERIRQLFGRVPTVLHRRFADRLWEAIVALAPADEADAGPDADSDTDAITGTSAAAATSSTGAGSDDIAGSNDIADINRAIEAWYAPDGWVREHIRTCREVIEAIARHEAQAIDGLITAAQELVISMEADA